MNTPAFYVTEKDSAEDLRRWLERGPRYRSVEALVEPPLDDPKRAAKLVLLLRGRPPLREVKKRVIYPLPDERELREQIAPYRPGWRLGPVALLRAATEGRSRP